METEIKCFFLFKDCTVRNKQFVFGLICSKEEMQKLRFVHFYYHNTIYFNNKSCYLSVYVDDFRIVELNLLFIIELKNQLIAKFNTKDLEPTAHYLSIKI